jgi:DNA-binding Lrp family transcriptional regulator
MIFRMSINLDKIDFEILKILMEDSRTPITLIAKKLEISRPTVRQRIRKLKKMGIIQKFTITINENIGGNIRTIIGFKAHDVNELINIIKNRDEITEIYITGGERNIICKAVFPDTSSLKDFIMEFLEKNIPIDVSIILETVKKETGVISQSIFQLRCDYCGKEIKDKPYTHVLYNRTFNFCCPTCLRDFKRIREF